MTEATAPSAGQHCAWAQALDELRGAGVARCDPVRFHYLEALARRVAAQAGPARHLLEQRLEAALAAYRTHHAVTRAAADAAIVRVAQARRELPAEAVTALRADWAAGDFSGVRRAIARLDTSDGVAELAALVRRLEPGHVATRVQAGSASQQRGASKDAVPPGQSGPRRELKSVRDFRATWSRLSVDKQVAQAMEQAPENAGPLNSHHLVLRSLALMRDASPEYLDRFMSYMDTLLRLDQAEKESKPPPKKSARTKGARR